MKSAFRKISRVRSLLGGTSWYLSEDCLLAAKRVMYVVEYQRFYLRDLESVVVWPSRVWLPRMIIPGVLLAALGALLWRWTSTVGAILLGMSFAWVLLELALGPTARSRISITGATLELPLVYRTRRARKILTKIDAAVVAARRLVEQSAAPAAVSQPAETSAESISQPPATTSGTAATQTHAS